MYTHSISKHFSARMNSWLHLFSLPYFPKFQKGHDLNKTMLSHSVVSGSLQPTRLLCPWNFPGKNVGVGCHFLLQRIFLTQGFEQPSPTSVSCTAGELFTQLSHEACKLRCWLFVFSQLFSQSVVSDSLCSYGPWPIRLLCLWDSPGKNTGVGCHSLPQRSSQPRDWTFYVSCIGSWDLYY